MIHTAGTTLIVAGVDCSGTGKRVCPYRFGGIGHHRGEAGAVERWHGIFPRPRALEDIPSLVQLARDVASLSGNADFVFHLVVIGFQLLQSKGPIFHSRTIRDARCAIARHGGAPDLEVPGIQAPALRPIVNGGAADRVHHGMHGRSRRIGRALTAAMGRHLAIRLLNQLRPATIIVA